MSSGQTYGEALPDQVDRLASLSDAQLDLLADVRELFRERAALEREHAGRLQLLAKKAGDKRAKMIVRAVVGEEPTKAWNDSTLKHSTLDTAYSQLLAFVAEGAQDHVKLADALATQVADVLKSVEKRHEDAKKKQMQYFQKLLSDRDRVYNDRIKSKQKYDEECTEVESYRQKQGKAHDDRHAERAARQFEQQEADMNTAKNTYLLSISIANRMKAKFYEDDLPALENQLQRLQTALITSFSTLLVQATSIEAGHLDTMRRRVDSISSAASAIDSAKDQDLFIDYNIRPFSAPNDFAFEPCAVHYDTPDVSVAPAAKVILQNRLGKSRAKLQELGPVLDTKRSDLERMAIELEVAGSTPNTDNTLEIYLDTAHDVTSFASSECILQAEIDTIVAALQGDEGGQKPHQFKSSSFSIPTSCGYCKTSIWGLSKQGKTCKLCGLAVHGKCELKVPADCGGARGLHGDTGGTVTARSTTAKHAPSSSSISSISSLSDKTQTPSSFVDNSSMASSQEYMSGLVLYSYTATSPFELSVAEGTTVMILEDDDGSGWLKVDNGTGGKGLVPASYVDMGAEGAPPAVAASSQHGSGQYVRGMYDYAAQGPDEMSVTTGQVIELSAGPSGGQNYASGWWEGVTSSGKKAIFPSNYVELV